MTKMFFLLLPQASDGNTAGLLIPLEKSILTMKVLRKSIIHGMRKPHENPDVMVFLNTLLEQARLVLNFREYKKILIKYLKKIIVENIRKWKFQSFQPGLGEKYSWLVYSPIIYNVP